MLVGALFMAMPLLGYQFILEMKQLVQKGQEQALMLEAKAIASVLHERKELFSKDTGILLNQQDANNLSVYPLVQAIKIDGIISDWSAILQNAKFYGKDNQIVGAPPQSDKDISFWHLLAYDNDFIYALFQVSDDQVELRKKDSLSLVQSDHIRIYVLNEKGETENYILNTIKPGTMSAYKVKNDWQTATTGKHDSTFLANFAKNKTGYIVELRVPMELLMQSRNIAFAVVDYNQSKTKVISTVSPEKDNKLNRILLRSPHIENILEGLDKPHGRIWVVDLYQRVRAVVGSLQSKVELNKPDWSDFIFDFLLVKPNYDFTDHPEDVEYLANKSIVKALKNEANNFVRQSLDQKATILGAVTPIEHNGKIVGAVVVEQTNNNMLALENDVLLKVLKQIAVIFLVATVTIIWFAVRLTYRINRLHQETNAATTDSGKIKTDTKITVHSKDELGKLASSIAQMLSSLSQHTKYLERMPRTLRHEILNPLSVISTSLENLQNIAKPSPQEAKYLNSAQNGIKRLGSILMSLTEASNLESALTSEEKILFDVNELLAEYLDNYQSLHPEYQINIKLAQKDLLINGWPESIAQMLDKILDNALEFTSNKSSINLEVEISNKYCIYISNEGNHIPKEIQENIFESMVSMRSDKTKLRPHLGIGLYVARVIIEAHNGQISVRNLNNPKGVEFAICLPINQPTTNYQKGF